MKYVSCLNHQTHNPYFAMCLGYSMITVFQVFSYNKANNYFIFTSSTLKMWSSIFQWLYHVPIIADPLSKRMWNSIFSFRTVNRPDKLFFYGGKKKHNGHSNRNKITAPALNHTLLVQFTASYFVSCCGFIPVYTNRNKPY